MASQDTPRSLDALFLAGAVLFVNAQIDGTLAIPSKKEGGRPGLHTIPFPNSINYKSSFANDPDSQVRLARAVLQNGRTLEARRIVKPLATAPNASANALCVYAKTFIDDPDQADANNQIIESSLQKALKADPNSGEANSLMCTWRVLQGRNKEAADLGYRALKNNPANVWICPEIAGAEVNLGHYNEALALINRYMERDKDPGDYHWMVKADILGNLKRYDEAIVCCKHALKKRHSDELVFRTVRYMDAAGKYDDAITELNGVIKANPNDAEAYAFRAKIEAKKNMNAQALQDYGDAIKMEASTKLYKERMALYRKLGKTKEADQDQAKIKALEAAPY